MCKAQSLTLSFLLAMAVFTNRKVSPYDRFRMLNKLSQSLLCFSAVGAVKYNINIKKSLTIVERGKTLLFPSRGREKFYYSRS